MFAVKLDHTNFLTNPLFNITWERREYTTATNGSKIKTLYPMQFEPCRPDHWTGLPSYGLDWEQAFSDGGLQQYLCPKIEDVIRFGGTYDNFAYNFAKVQIAPCKNSTDPSRLWQPSCQTQQQVNAFFNTTQSVTIMFRMNNYVINPGDAKEPIKSYIEDSLFFPVQPGTAYQTADIYLTENNLITDQSILPFQNLESEKFMIFDGKFRLQYVIGNTNKIVADFYIRKDPISFDHNRVFTKISQMASYIGGFCQTFILIAAIIVHQYNGYVCTIKIANKLYDFDLDGESGDAHARREKFDERIEKVYGKQLQASKYATKMDQSKYSEPNLLQRNTITQKDQRGMATSIYQQENYKAKLKDEKQLPTVKQQELPFIQIQGSNNDKNGFDQQQRKQVSLGSGNQTLNVVSSPLMLSQQKSDSTQQQLSYQESTQSAQQTLLPNTAQNIHSNQNLAEKISSVKQPAKQNGNENNDFYKNKVAQNNVNQEISVIFDDSVMSQTPNKETVKKIQFPKMSSMHNKSTNLQGGDSRQLENQKEKKLKIMEASGLEKSRNNDAKRCFTEIQSMNKMDHSSRKQLTINPNAYTNQRVTITDQNNQSLPKEDYLDEKQFLRNEFKYLTSRDSSIKLTFKYILYKLSCGKCFKTKESELLDKAQQMMEQDTDIFMILSGIKEMQKLKNLLLTKEQQILFNFFPKQVISINKDQELPSRTQIEHRKKEISQSLKVESKRQTQEINNHQRKLKLSMRAAILVQKATNKFKQSIQNRRVIQYNNIDAYQKLYDAYQAISKNESSEMNDKLVKELGEEINTIFRLSKEIQKNKERYIMRLKNQLSKNKEQTTTQDNEGNYILADKSQRQTNQFNRNKIPTLSAGVAAAIAGAEDEGLYEKRFNTAIQSQENLNYLQTNLADLKTNNNLTSLQSDTHRPLTSNQLNLGDGLISDRTTQNNINDNGNIASAVAVATDPTSPNTDKNQKDNPLILFDEQSVEFFQSPDPKHNKYV